MLRADFQLAEELMADFAQSTGLRGPSQPPARYLWTDAFAVCNFLELYQKSGDTRYRQMAIELMDQVHESLGKHRPDDSRSGWISGLSEADGREHPTVGGLRIGKNQPERGPADPLDEQLEWDRDGQYYHYLTKWMHALNRMSAVTGVVVHGRWARELASAGHAAFRQTPSLGQRPWICWKMSIDLSRPQVPSAGLHDPLDGLITCLELQARTDPGSTEATELGVQIKQLSEMCEGGRWFTDDPLGIGGLLFDACRMLQLGAGPLQNCCKGLLPAVLDAALGGIVRYSGSRPFEVDVSRRLAFRELGLAIGLRGVATMMKSCEQEKRASRRANDTFGKLEALERFSGLGKVIEATWRMPETRRSRAWNDHRDINTVMLATALMPGMFLSV